MERILKVIILVLFTGTIFSALIYYLNPDFYRIIIKEDGILEYLTAFILLAGSALLLIRLIRVARIKKAQWIAFNILMILGLFFAFGEELSWGQRIFSIESSDFFIERNAQKETNLHNLVINGIKLNKVLFTYVIGIIFGFYFIFALLLYKKSQFSKKIITRFGIPVPRIYHSVILFAATIIITTVPDSKKWEIWECLFAVIFFLVILQPYNIEEKPMPATKQEE